MNILHLTHTDINSDSRILKEMSSLANSNKEYELYGIGIFRDKNRYSSTIDKLNIYSLKLKSRNINFFPTTLKHFFILIEFYFKLIVTANKIKPSIIHCHDTLVLPAGVIIKLFTKSKLIYDAHELESKKNGISKVDSKIILFTEKIIWSFINKLIVVSPSIESWYESNLGKKSTEIIMNSPYIENEKIIKNNYLKELYGIPNNKKIFIYIGGLVNGRGIESLIRIFSNKEIKSHIIFLGYGELRETILENSNKYNNIHLHDAVPHEKVLSIAKSADVGLCLIENISLSDYYCLPNKLFEYTFAEIPILASNFPDIKEVIDKYNLGKYSELDEESIYNSIKEFENEQELKKIDSSKLYELSWQRQEEKLISLYDSLNSK